jgi:phosphoenolpyruvate---glycerone phosphotransferase subunit DhaL
MMEFTAKDFINYFKSIVEMIEQQKDYLCELDRKVGDGDHGVTMSIGWQAVNEKLNKELAYEEDPAKVNLTVGKTFLSAVGSSVGPLYATGFMRGAKVVKGKTIVNDQDLIEFWIAFGKGIQERGGAQVGDKTMVDTLAPFVIELETQFNQSRDFVSAFTSAVNEAKKGMESTKDLLSKKGRSSRLGNRSIGVQDPGATSCYLLLEAFLNYVNNKVEKEN